MGLHFTSDEFAARRAKAIAAMQAGGLDGLLIFRQESMYYLTGYDTFGYVFFQCLYLGADGRLMLLTRAPDLRQARHTSVVEDVRVWVDGPDAEPARELRQALASFGLSGRRLGVEYEAYGLTARNGQRLQAALDGFCTLIDASDLVSRLRLVKSPAEIAYVRRAGELADAAIGEVFDAHAVVLDRAGYRAHRMNATGYSLGTTFAPNWMDWPMFYHGNPELAAPGQVYFIHIIIFDDEAGLAMTTGQTVLVGERGAEPLSRQPLD